MKYDYALVSGGFDPVHLGHLQMFQDASKLADNVVVLLNSDEWLTRKKGRPFMDQVQRKAILEEMNCVSQVNIQSQDTDCLLYTSPSPRDLSTSRMPSSA